VLILEVEMMMEKRCLALEYKVAEMLGNEGNERLVVFVYMEVVKLEKELPRVFE